jgi:hydrophobic/amphiphilic exporter-1 (mainly G- bacteria), HAE1 family
MNLADLSIRRPTFITCIVLVMLAVGFLSMQRLGVDLFPDITFPVVTVTTPYPGAGPSEIENLVTKPIEDEVSTISGLKRITSNNLEGTSRIIAEFTLETDVKYAEQQIRDRVSGAKRKLPTDIKEPVIRRIDPADQPVLILAVDADLQPAALFDVADEWIKPKLQSVNQVGLVEILGGRKREIHVALDRRKLKAHEISASQVADRISAAGENVPAGKVNETRHETVFRTLGEFKSPQEIGGTIVSFYGSDVPTTVSQLGTVQDTLTDETSRTFVNGKKSLFLYVFRQSGANTIAVVDALRKQIDKLNGELANSDGKPKLTIVRDGSWWIHANVDDVKDSILMGVVLAVFVVFLFLANGRSTIITGLALPNSLIGAFVLMAAAGFTINIMTLLALSLSVGLLIDDAIVVRENIFRHLEMGKSPKQAALEGTGEVRLAVIATTLTVIAVFGPIGFLKGVVGQFFKQFGLTICFAMLISLFDALTIAPMLSAYFAGKKHASREPSLWDRTIGVPLRAFGRFQDWLEHAYGGVLKGVLRRPLLSLGISLVIFFASMSLGKFVPKTFLPPQDSGEFVVGLDLAPGTNLDRMTEVSRKADEIMRANPEVEVTTLTVGSRDGEANKSELYVHLIPAKKRSMNTSQVKDRIREQLKEVAFANPLVKDFDPVAGGQRPFNLNLISFDQKELEVFADKVLERLKKDRRLKDMDTSYRAGKPEFQVQPDAERARQLGVSTRLLGGELRTQVEGLVAAKLRSSGHEYDIRVRLQEDQRNLKEGFPSTYVPNINMNLVRLADVAKPVETTGLATINRQDRGRLIILSGDITPGAGIGDVIADLKKEFAGSGELKLPPGMRYAFPGQGENFEELGNSIPVAMGLGVLFIFLVLASLYESFITPLTIMLALPLAFCGSLVALAVTRQSLNIFSMIGIIMLLGISTKNSILLVDYANQLILEGMDRAEALIKSGKTRLRPILMTTMALIAGTAPVALGLNEASRQRTSMGIAIIGGLISSTLLTLIVVPAAFVYIDRFRVWSRSIFGAPRKQARAAAPQTGSYGPAAGKSSAPAANATSA